MRLTILHLVHVSVLLAQTIVTALPFRTRGASDKEEKQNENNGSKKKQQHHHEDDHNLILNLQPGSSSKGKYRNAVVETFFATGQNSKNDFFEAASNDLLHEIRRKATNLHDFLIQTRRALHKHPELMYQEDETSAAIQSILKEWGIPFTTGWAVNIHTDVTPGLGGYGIVADIGTGHEPCVLLRADMDALPILEQTNKIDEFKSQYPGKMHACGHDAHSTILLGAASILKNMEDSLNGTIRIVFQPAEEGGAGAKRMIEEGVLKRHPKPAHAFALHVWPTFPSSVIASCSGALLAAAERFTITLQGVGGHAAMPHLTVDPVVCAAAIVMNLQTIVSRTVNPLEAGVISVTELHAGEAFNIMPDHALVRGTIRALSTETLLDLRDRLETMVLMMASAHKLIDVNVTYSPDFYPPTINDPDLYEQFSKPVGALVSPEGFVRDTEPTLGSEDFSFLANEIPSTFFLLGSGSGAGHHHSPPTDYGLHHPQFALDESVMSKGVELQVNLAIRALHRLGQDDNTASGLSSRRKKKKTATA